MPVTNIVTVNKGMTSVTVSWTAPDQQGASFSGYEYKLFDPAITAPVQKDLNLPSGTTSQSFDSLTPGNTYRYEIMPFRNNRDNRRLYGGMVSKTFTMGKCIMMF